jgi:hypothetical protein
MLKRLGLEKGHEKNDPVRQQIILVNKDQIDTQKQMLQKMSAKKIEETVDTWDESTGKDSNK